MTVVVLAGFLRYTPLTYGSDWTLQACEKARWRKGWDFNCAQFPRDLAEFKNFPPSVQTLEWAQGKDAAHAELVDASALARFSTAELRAEIERRARAAWSPRRPPPATTCVARTDSRPPA